MTEVNPNVAVVIFPMVMSYMLQITNLLLIICSPGVVVRAVTPYSIFFLQALAASMASTAAAIFIPGLLDYGTVEKDVLHMWGSFFATQGIAILVYKYKIKKIEKR